MQSFKPSATTDEEESDRIMTVAGNSDEGVRVERYKLIEVQRGDKDLKVIMEKVTIRTGGYLEAWSRWK